MSCESMRTKPLPSFPLQPSILRPLRVTPLDLYHHQKVSFIGRKTIEASSYTHDNVPIGDGQAFDIERI